LNPKQLGRWLTAIYNNVVANVCDIFTNVINLLDLPARASHLFKWETVSGQFGGYLSSCPTG